MALSFKVASSSQAKQGGIIQRLTRSLPDYNWATWPIFLLRLCQRVLVDNVLIIPCTPVTPSNSPLASAPFSIQDSPSTIRRKRYGDSVRFYINESDSILNRFNTIHNEIHSSFIKTKLQHNFLKENPFNSIISFMHIQLYGTYNLLFPFFFLIVCMHL